MLARFLDDDFGYLTWLKEWADGYVLNADRRPNRSFLVAHRASCPAVRSSREGLTSRYLKVCATELEEIEHWCHETVGAHPTRCSECKP